MAVMVGQGAVSRIGSIVFGQIMMANGMLRVRSFYRMGKRG